jgi:beta-lactamase class A
LIRILTQQQLNDRLSADWPEAIAFAHKTGSLPGVEHDAGILYPEAWKLTHDSHLP